MVELYKGNTYDEKDYLQLCIRCKTLIRKKDCWVKEKYNHSKLAIACIVVGSILLGSLLIFIVMMVIKFYEFEILIDNTKPIITDMGSFGDFFGGTIGTLFTLTTGFYLAANYFESRKKRNYEHEKYVSEKSFERWENNFEELCKKLSETKVVIATSDGKGYERVETIRFMQVCYKSITTLCSKKPEDVITKKDYRYLRDRLKNFKGIYYTVLSELHKCPIKKSDPKLYKSKERYMNIHTPDFLSELARLSSLLEKLGFFKGNKHSSEYILTFSSDENIKHVLDKYGLERFELELDEYFMELDPELFHWDYIVHCNLVEGTQNSYRMVCEEFSLDITETIKLDNIEENLYSSISKNIKNIVSHEIFMKNKKEVFQFKIVVDESDED